MFPSAKAVSNDSQTDTHTQNELDWLKLGSFQPQVASQLYSQYQRDDIKETEDSSGEDLSSPESPVPHKKKKKEKHKHKKKKKKTRYKSPERVSPPPDKLREVLFKGNKVFIEEIPGLEFKDAYRVDRKSDTYTWNYGSLYKGHVARYHDNFNDCYGRTTLVQVMMKEKKSKKKDICRYYSKENRQIFLSPCSDRIVPKVLPTRPVLSDIISIKEPTVGKQSVDIRDRLLDEATAMYIQGKGTDSQTDDVMVVEENILYKTVAEFNRKTRENPHDVDMWIEFVDFQDKLAHEDINNRQITESSILDKKISIVQKAIEHNPGDITLKIKYLDLCKGTMAPESVIKEIEQLLFIHPTNMLLWKQYIIFHQSCLSIFTVSRVCKVYHKCFSKLIGYLEGKLYTHTTTKHLHTEVLDLLVQYCYFLKQVGQMEKAIASFQALIEFNLNCPDILQGQHEEAKVIFESFWDSGVPRVGESGAKGWSYWYTNKKLEPLSKPDSDENLEDKEKEIVKKEKTKWKIWMQIELERQAAHWLPWRPSENQTEEDCEDLDRLVLFDDISSILVPIPTSLHFEMVALFLHFLGLDVSNDLTVKPYSLDDLPSVIKDTKIDLLHRDEVKSLEMKENFIKCFIDQMIDRFKEESKTALILYKMFYHFDLCHNDSKKINRFKKIAKSMLKEEQNRNNLIVWGAYCDILRKCGFQNEAITVIETALSLVNDNNQKNGRLNLYCLLTELYLGISCGEKEAVGNCDLLKAQNALICFAEEKTNVKEMTAITATSVLRSRNKLEGLCDGCMENLTNKDKLIILTRSELKYICDTFRLLSLFEYSFGKHEIELATSVLEDAIKHLFEFLQGSQLDQVLSDKVQFVMENLFHFSIRLTKHHMSVNTSPLSTLRSIVEHAMKMFPDKPHFLKVFVEIELKTFICGRLDRYFSHILRSTKSPIPVMFAVYSILCRQSVINRQLQHQDETLALSKGGLINRIRSYLEKAIGISSVSQCPLVWRMYLLSEVQFGNQQRAQGIFYRALQSCPWSKALYMDAVSLFDGDKVEEIVDLMTEKEIRLQIPLEEVDLLLEGTTDYKDNMKSAETVAIT